MQFTSNNYKLVFVHELIFVCERKRFRICIKNSQSAIVPYVDVFVDRLSLRFIHVFCDLSVEIGELLLISSDRTKNDGF